jgi:hypothetical protein
MLFRGGRGLEGVGRAGEESSAPDWKMLLSSHPLSSAKFEMRPLRMTFRTGLSSGSLTSTTGEGGTGRVELIAGAGCTEDRRRLGLWAYKWC